MMRDLPLGALLVVPMLFVNQARAVPIALDYPSANYPYYQLVGSDTILHPGDVLSIGFSVKGAEPFVRPTSIANCPSIGPCTPVEDRVLTSEPATPNQLDIGFRFFDYSSSPGTTFDFYVDDALVYTHTADISFQSLSFSFSDSIFDFSSILDGTFSGRMDISNPSGDLSFEGGGLELTDYFLRECTATEFGTSCSTPLVPGLSVDSSEVSTQAEGPTPVPEPPTFLLLVIGAATLAASRRRA